MNYKKNILIWGTGLKGQRAFDVLTQYENTYNVVAFGNNDKNSVFLFIIHLEIYIVLALFFFFFIFFQIVVIAS